ncbi:MAG TPA: DUF488 family protein [Afifellaceae bacterium]|nr:DUF488 family protein [Afifellaceae bacterium]
MSRPAIRLKRVYDQPEPGDRTRVLVDRLWPRGIRKPDAAVHLWTKELGPSAELRRWFGHDPAKWEAFRRRYRQELAAKEDGLASLAEMARAGTVTLLFAARDATRNNAAVLEEIVEEMA